MNKIENKRLVGKTNKSKAGSLKKINKLGKVLPKIAKKKKEDRGH